MAYVLLFTMGLFKFCGSGPRYDDIVEKANVDCEYWWANMLYINNLYPVKNHVSSPGQSALSAKIKP